MSRIYGPYAYGAGPRAQCWWDDTCDIDSTGTLVEDLTCDVAIIGGGFTGLNAALTLARGGVSVVVLEAERVGWGASGRNGGFCCLGGGMASDDALDKQFGVSGRLDWRQTEIAAVRYVQDFLTKTETDADVHSEGETWLAHRPRDMAEAEGGAQRIEENYGVAPRIVDRDGLDADGMRGPFYGAVTVPIGFALNPRKYLHGLLRAATSTGARIFEAAPVMEMEQVGGIWHLRSGGRTIRTEQVIIATNGYSSEHLPRWLSGRYMPTQSAVAVTRPMSDNEIGAQGWTTRQMCYDSRNMLHYFRLMPDNRMLFGLRGGLLASPAAETRARARLRQDFDRIFPAWAHVEFTHYWSGMVCIARDMMPYVGPVPGQPGLLTALCYHGNGVGMASYSGALVAEIAMGDVTRRHPAAMQRPLRRFPFGAARRVVMPPIYLGKMLADL